MNEAEIRAAQRMLAGCRAELAEALGVDAAHFWIELLAYVRELRRERDEARSHENAEAERCECGYPAVGELHECSVYPTFAGADMHPTEGDTIDALGPHPAEPPC